MYVVVHVSDDIHNHSNEPLSNLFLWVVQGPSMSQRTYLPAFPLKHQQKDMRLAIALGDKLGQALPTAAAANELYKQVLVHSMCLCLPSSSDLLTL